VARRTAGIPGHLASPEICRARRAVSADCAIWSNMLGIRYKYYILEKYIYGVYDSLARRHIIDIAVFGLGKPANPSANGSIYRYR